MQRVASFSRLPRPFNTIRRAIQAVRAHHPVPCWTEYLRETRD